MDWYMVLKAFIVGGIICISSNIGSLVENLIFHTPVRHWQAGSIT